ncbi:hypothetical protein BC834DRAFT_20390 [Gloeopeniophorella convolvens]|nr:hypothetical protein BC834DRAFT_20390 [Gloeopeniophorella convolvens]
MATHKANSSLFARRKAFAIKHHEAEPLTRRDLQYDFLHHVFASQERVFTDPNLPANQDGPQSATFRDLYVHALTSSPRCSKALREKMQDTPDFATDFAKISLLANVGRVNTTMTFLPEMRTALRTYHPVPSLQKADANLQDAPRIKNILKACSLKDEANAMPVTPAELRARAANGTVPSSSIVNLLFVLSNHFTTVAHEHFGRLDIDFLDLFLPVQISSISRARAFLWLAFHYHQGPAANPFDDQHSRQHLGLVPKLVPLTEQEFEQENVDTDDEKEYAAKMTKVRMDFLAKNAQANEGNTSKVQKGSVKAKASALSPPDKAVPAKRERSDPDSLVEDTNTDDVPLSRPPQRKRAKPVDAALAPSETSTARAPPNLHRHPSGGFPRSILQQAWHVVTTVDAFFESDEEDLDEPARHAYAMRLQVLADFHQSSTTTPTHSHQWQRASAS